MGEKLFADGPDYFPSLLDIIVGYREGDDNITQASALYNAETLGH
jgi:hypothetical protein